MVNPEQTQEYDIPEEMARPLVIKTRDLTKSFNGEIAVNKINLEVPEGAILGFIGPSGSGKTTTVRLLMGLYVPDSGEISVLGVPLPLGPINPKIAPSGTSRLILLTAISPLNDLVRSRVLIIKGRAIPSGMSYSCVCSGLTILF